MFCYSRSINSTAQILQNCTGSFLNSLQHGAIQEIPDISIFPCFQSKDLFRKEREGITQSIMDCKLQVWGMLLNSWAWKVLGSAYSLYCIILHFSWRKTGKVLDLSLLSSNIKTLFFFLIFFSVLCHKLPWQPEKHRVFKEKLEAHFGVDGIFSKLNRAEPYGPTF